MSAVKDDPVLEAFLRHLDPVRGRIERIILFGSRARGDEKPYSDDYFLLVVEERERSLMDAIPTPFFAAVLTEGIPIG